MVQNTFDDVAAIAIRGRPYVRVLNSNEVVDGCRKLMEWYEEKRCPVEFADMDGRVRCTIFAGFPGTSWRSTRLEFKTLSK